MDNNKSTNMELKLLSICIPTYNRREQIVALIKDMLKVQGSFEVCVHVDGSTDGTFEALRGIDDRRLNISFAENLGRASALLSACELAHGRYIMIFDDDDTLYVDGLLTVLKDCATVLPENVVGHIYHLEGPNHKMIGDVFTLTRSNFLSLRADYDIKGDKKEVVLANEFRRVAYDNGCRHFRRVPTSLIWSRLACSYDVLCHNEVIGRKVYYEDGLSANIHLLKSQNAYPMFLLYAAHLSGFVNRRYNSWKYLVKAIVGIGYYGMLAIFAAFYLDKMSSRG